MSQPFAVELVPGMIADDTTFALPGTVEDGSRVRCWRDRWQTTGGWPKCFVILNEVYTTWQHWDSYEWVETQRHVKR